MLDAVELDGKLFFFLFHVTDIYCRPYICALCMLLVTKMVSAFLRLESNRFVSLQYFGAVSGC